MNIPPIPFGVTDWDRVEITKLPGTFGEATWRTISFDSMRVRMVEYSAGYAADHWCEKGHILLVLEGELLTELKDGRCFMLKAGMSYQVGDGVMPHRSRTESGVRLFIVD